MLQWIQESLRRALSGQDSPRVFVEKRGRANSSGLAQKAAVQLGRGIDLLSYEDSGSTVEWFMVGDSAIGGPDPIRG